MNEIKLVNHNLITLGYTWCIIVQALDLYVSNLAGVERELNFVMGELWIRYGFWLMPTFKFGVVLGLIGLHLIIRKHYKFTEKPYLVGFIMANILASLVVIHNFIVL